MRSFLLSIQNKIDENYETYINNLTILYQNKN